MAATLSGPHCLHLRGAHDPPFRCCLRVPLGSPLVARPSCGYPDDDDPWLQREKQWDHRVLLKILQPLPAAPSR
jgi:hypothetical protein